MSATRVSHGVRISAIARSTAVSIASTTATVRVATTTAQATRTSPLSASHHFPEALRCRGRGGGSPDGRRRLPDAMDRRGAGRMAGAAAAEAAPAAAMP